MEKSNKNSDNLFIDIFCAQRNHYEEEICGDSFLFRRIDNGNRLVIVLSDGMGHGVKANILSTLTSTLILNFDHDRSEIKYAAETLLKSLPICSSRKICYSTFTVVDINLVTKLATVIEYDNPECIVLRGNRQVECKWQNVQFENDITRQRTIRTALFEIEEGDMIVAMSDGVTQSGINCQKYPFGWQRSGAVSFVESILNINSDSSSREIAEGVVGRAIENDNYRANDDISCMVTKIRRPNSLLLCSCPPQHSGLNSKMIDIIDSFDGGKIVCGYHLAKLISSLKATEITKSDISLDSDVQPMWYMDGVDFITESLVTLNKVYYLLQNSISESDGEGAAFEVYSQLLKADTITVLMGMSSGNGGEYMVDEYELRRKAMGYIVRILEKRYLKEVNVIYN